MHTSFIIYLYICYEIVRVDYNQNTDTLILGKLHRYYTDSKQNCEFIYK